MQLTEQELCIDCMTKAVCGYSLSHVFHLFTLLKNVLSTFLPLPAHIILLIMCVLGDF